MGISARIISIIFHPLLMASYLFGLLSFTLPSALEPIQMKGQFTFVLLIFLITFLLPALNIVVFKLFGSIKSLTMYDRRERIIPFIFITILYCSVTGLFYFRFGISLQDNVLRLMSIVSLLVLVATCITFFYKISIHSLSMCGLLGILIPLNKMSDNSVLLFPTIAIIIITGVVMSSRLLLNAHTAREVYIGALTGFTTSLCGIIVLF